MNLSESFSRSEALGRDESLPGAPILRFISPTDFDNVREAMRISIKEKLDWDFFNPLAWKTIGLTGGPVDKFLINYKEVSTKFKEGYTDFNKQKWVSYFTSNLGYDNEEAEILFDTFGNLVLANKVPDSIYRPWLYEPSKDSSFDKYLKMGLKYAVIGGVVYLVIINSPKLIKGFSKNNGS